MFEDFLKRMTSGFAGTMFLITLPIVMLVVGLLCYTLLGMFGLEAYAIRLFCATPCWGCSVLKLMPSGWRGARRLLPALCSATAGISF